MTSSTYIVNKYQLARKSLFSSHTIIGSVSIRGLFLDELHRHQKLYIINFLLELHFHLLGKEV